MEANYFTILWWFLPDIQMNHPWVHMCLPILKPLPSPSPPHPSGLSQSTNFECLASCIELALVIYFTCGYICFSAILSNQPTVSFSRNPKVFSLHPCLFCCVAYRVIITIFLNSIYMCYYTVLVFFFLTYFTLLYSLLYRLQFHPPH